MKGGRDLIHLLFLWISLWSLYLVATGEIGMQEVVAGGVVSAAVTALSLKVRSTLQNRYLPKLRWLLPFLKIPWTMLQECWLLLLALHWKIFCPSRFKGGSFIEYDIPPVSEEDAVSRDALTTFGVCLTPNDYIISIDRDRNVAHIRILVGRDLSGADKDFLELK